jgi:hypothetical protein
MQTTHTSELYEQVKRAYRAPQDAPALQESERAESMVKGKGLRVRVKGKNKG